MDKRNNSTTIPINRSEQTSDNSEPTNEEIEGLLQRLPMLQDKINKDPQSYREEFEKILAFFRIQFDQILLSPNKQIKGFKELLLFFAHISNVFQSEISFIPESLIKVLEENYLIIPHEIRLGIVEALSLLRKKDLLTSMEVIPLFFSLIKCQDKILRKKLCDCIISDLTKINLNHKSSLVNQNLQNYCEKLLTDPNKKQARKTLNIMITLYQKKIWNDSRTINAIGTCVASNDIKISSAAAQFFLSEYHIDEVDSSSEEELGDLKNKYKLLGKASNRKTKQRKNKLKMLMKSIERKEKRHSKVTVNKDFMPIDQLNDPYAFSETLFQKANTQSGNYQNKLTIIRLLGRVLGRHRLLLNNYFNFMLKYLNSNQKDVSVILASLIEACHDQVPPNELEPVIDKLFDNFIAEAFPAPLVTLGLNALREIIERCPYCINKAEFDVVVNLKEYKNKSVSNAARSIVNLCKEIDGKYGKATANQIFAFDKTDDTIDGIELLKKLENKPKEYRMECEEILDQDQIRKLRALKMKYNAENILHTKVGITDDDIKQLGRKRYRENDNDNEGEQGEQEEEEGELEEIEDEEEGEFEDEEGEFEELEEEEGLLEEYNDDDDEEENEEIELNSSEADLSINEDEMDDEDEENVHGFLDPSKLEQFKKTRRERIDELKNEEKEKYVRNQKEKKGGKTNKEKMKNKPLMMVLPKKRHESKVNRSKLISMNKKIKNIKQQLGRFKKGNMVLKKKNGVTRKKNKK